MSPAIPKIVLWENFGLTWSDLLKHRSVKQNPSSGGGISSGAENADSLCGYRMCKINRIILKTQLIARFSHQ